jgi:hypothetical protein
MGWPRSRQIFPRKSVFRDWVPDRPFDLQLEPTVLHARGEITSTRLQCDPSTRGLAVTAVVAPAGEARRYYCPVCGIDLPGADFDLAERDYYCPFCSSRQGPQSLDVDAASWET